MKKSFVCLANSKKFGGRCLAGIAFSRDELGKIHLIRTPAGKPQWVRPVGRTEHGEVPNLETKHIHLLDLVEFEPGAPCPQGYQCENMYYHGKIFTVNGNLNLKRENLDQLIENEGDNLLGSRTKYLTDAEAEALGHSIVLIKPEAGSLRFHENGAHLRLDFSWHGARYDLPVTDIDFHLRWIDDPELLAGKEHVYLCISLTIPLEGKHHKLVAGVIG
jgi:hypothetical protein